MPQANALEERLRSVAQDAPAQEPPKPIDREKTCPLLLRVFVSDDGRHHRADDFTKTSVPNNELQIYTWMDATLKELTSLVKEVRSDARKKGTVFKFSVVYQDRTGRFRMRDIGQTIGGRKGPSDQVTLASQQFEIGDFMDIAISMVRENRRMQY